MPAFLRIWVIAVAISAILCPIVQTAAGATEPLAASYFRDPQTGNVYRRVERSFDRPITATETNTRERTIYRPEVLSEVRTEQRTVYTPTVQYEWEPEWVNRWNPFVQPTLAYRYVPRMRWQAQQQSYQIPQTQTRWVAEKQIENVPRQVAQLQRETRIEYHLVHGGPASAIADETVVARLQSAPLQQPSHPSHEVAAPMSTTIASIPTGTYNDLPRSFPQSGMRPSVLSPQPQPVPASDTEVARLPPARLWR